MKRLVSARECVFFVFVQAVDVTKCLRFLGHEGYFFNRDGFKTNSPGAVSVRGFCLIIFSSFVSCVSLIEIILVFASFLRYNTSNLFLSHLICFGASSESLQNLIVFLDPHNVVQRKLCSYFRFCMFSENLSNPTFTSRLCDSHSGHSCNLKRLFLRDPVPI